MRDEDCEAKGNCLINMCWNSNNYACYCEFPNRKGYTHVQ